MKYGLAATAALATGVALGRANHSRRDGETGRRASVEVPDPSTWKKSCQQPSFTFTAGGNRFLLEPRKLNEYNLLVAATKKNARRFNAQDEHELRRFAKVRPPGRWFVIDEGIYIEATAETEVRAELAEVVQRSLGGVSPHFFDRY